MRMNEFRADFPRYSEAALGPVSVEALIRSGLQHVSPNE